MGKDLQEKVKRTRKSRERRSIRAQTKQAQFEYDQIQEINPRHHAPSAPPINQIDNARYGK